MAARGGSAGRDPLARGADAVCNDLSGPVPAGRPSGAHQRAPYASDFDEVKSLGRATGSSRTPDQTVIAFYWTDNTISPLEPNCRLCRARAAHLVIARTHGLFGLLNVAMADAGHCGLGCQIRVQVLAAVQRRSACR